MSRVRVWDNVMGMPAERMKMKGSNHTSTAILRLSRSTALGIALKRGVNYESELDILP